MEQVAESLEHTCEWHEDEEPVQGIPPGCPNCGNLYITKTCKRCQRTFVDYGARGFDDVCAAQVRTAQFYARLHGVSLAQAVKDLAEREQKQKREAEQARKLFGRVK